MKFIFICICIYSFGIIDVKGQIQVLNDFEDLYLNSLERFSNSFDFDKLIYLSDNEWFGMKVRDNIKNNPKFILTSLTSVYKRKGPNEIYTVIPVRLKNDKFYITIIRFHIKSRVGKTYETLNQGGMNFYYSYNCQTGIFTPLPGD